jgi:LuxR family transcriptional regulator, maltose regulon positive regulatory protein
MPPDHTTVPLRPLRSARAAPNAFGAPRVAPGLVPRPRLLRRLAAARDVPLVLVVAPAGYGKTTLLAEWAARDERRFAWVRPAELEERGAGQRLLERHADDGPVVIAVDDVQLASRAAIAELADAACLLPDGSTLAVASRRRLGPPAARRSAHRLTLELGPGDLAMTRLEAALLLAAAGLHLDGAAVDGLVARTQGWPAALAIAAQALAEQPPAGDAARAFGGTDRMLAGYLRSQLLAELPAHRLAFLRRTSIAEELSPGLCDAIIGRGDASRTLEAVAGADVGLEPVDRTGGAFRLHPLVRELLRADLERLEPGLAAELHRRAAAWHRRHGRLEAALRHAVATGDAARAGHVLWAMAPAAAAAGHGERLEEWLRPFGPRELAAHPELAMSAAAHHLAEGRREDAERWIAAADAAARRVARGPQRTAALALLRACAGSGGVAAMGGDAARAAALMAPGQPWHALATLLQGVARHLTGDREAARALLGRAVRPEPGGIALVRALGLAQLALLDAEGDAWDRAADHAMAARAALAGVAAPPPVAALVHAADAVAAAHRGEAADARRATASAHALLAGDDGLPPWLAVEAQVWLARAEIRLSDAAAARALLARAARRLPSADGAPLLGEWLHQGWERADAFAAGATGELPALTNAELRVLRFLPSHLTFREIGARLHVSANTVKTQALSAYRKLDVGSRSEAVARGRAVGLIDG